MRVMLKRRDLRRVHGSVCARVAGVSAESNSISLQAVELHPFCTRETTRSRVVLKFRTAIKVEGSSGWALALAPAASTRRPIERERGPRASKMGLLMREERRVCDSEGMVHARPSGVSMSELESAEKRWPEAKEAEWATERRCRSC